MFDSDALSEYEKQIYNHLVTLNYHYGRGNIVAFSWDAHTGTGSVTRKFQYGQNIVSFKMIDFNRLHFLGKRRNITRDPSSYIR